jgi:phosphoadenosine phosphosulfate reductase
MNTVDIDRDAAETLASEALVEQVLQQGGKACLTNSFQIEDMVVLHLLRQVAPNIPVLFLDTGYHFKEHMRIAIASQKSGD